MGFSVDTINTNPRWAAVEMLFRLIGDEEVSVTGLFGLAGLCAVVYVGAGIVAFTDVWGRNALPNSLDLNRLSHVLPRYTR